MKPLINCPFCFSILEKESWSEDTQFHNCPLMNDEKCSGYSQGVLKIQNEFVVQTLIFTIDKYRVQIFRKMPDSDFHGMDINGVHTRETFDPDFDSLNKLLNKVKNYYLFGK